MNEHLKEIEEKAKEQIKAETGIPKKYIYICTINDSTPCEIEYRDSRIDTTNQNYGAKTFALR